ncbi:MAG: hypothetical protein AB7H77_03660 [Bdellovibrionales bacterium]
MNFSHWIAAVMGGFTLLLAGAVAVLLTVNAGQRTELGKAQAARAVLEEANRGWAEKTRRASAALAALAAADQARAAAAARAEKRAAVEARKLEMEAAALAAFTAPGAECAAVTALRDFYLGHKQ